MKDERGKRRGEERREKTRHSTEEHLCFED
jgi:hypothetical protein